MEDHTLRRARLVFDTMCTAVERKGWVYRKEEDAPIIRFGVDGIGLPLQIIMAVDTERQLIRVSVPMPMHVPEDKRLDFAAAVCAANCGMCIGGFNFDITEGNLLFRLASSFRESEIGEGLFRYLIDYVTVVAGTYSERFFDLCADNITLDEFLAMRG